MEQQLLDFIFRVYQLLAWPGVVLLMAIESACIPLPSELIMPLAGWMLVANNGLGIGHLVLAGFAGAVGNVIGSLIAYWVGYRGGLPFLNRYGKYILITHHDIQRASRWFDKYGEWIVFLSRLMPAVRTFISLPAGIAKMNIGKFILYSFAGAFPWSFALAYGGYVLGQNWEQIREVMRPFDIPIVAIGVLLIIAFFALRIRSISREKVNPVQSVSPIKEKPERRD